MCELNVMLVKDGEKELVMESVTKMVVDGDSVELFGIFGEREVVSGSIKEVNFATGETIIVSNQ